MLEVNFLPKLACRLHWENQLACEILVCVWHVKMLYTVSLIKHLLWFKDNQRFRKCSAFPVEMCVQKRVSCTSAGVSALVLSSLTIDINVNKWCQFNVTTADSVTSTSGWFNKKYPNRSNMKNILHTQVYVKMSPVYRLQQSEHFSLVLLEFVFLALYEINLTI